MNKKDWAIVNEVFELALSASQEEQERLIESRLGNRSDLADKVRSLLAEDASASTFGASDAAAAAIYALDRLEADAIVGRYKIVRRIGEGGMGSVYLAERADSAFEKQVALKLIRGDLNDQAIERFGTERQALAQLEHPNIAMLLDGGVDEQSRPYVAMEYVDGLPITHHCDQQQLSINIRIGLFIDLCDAVQHAHRNLIVHRDIKPSNVLVTSEGTVKLLDFGIAKLLGPGQQQALTATAARVLTPDYASPEQVTGGAITTATDVYQLGVLLYELLCGLRPLDTGQLTPSQFEAALIKGDITAPSRFPERLTENADKPQLIAKLRNLSAERLSQSLQGDLDTIVSKAMAPEASQRYASPADLAADLHRYIEGLPIEARPASVGYRTRKFIGRNKLGVSIAAGVVAMVIGFTGYLISQAEQIRLERDTAQRERDTAEQEKERAEAVTDFLVDTFAQANPMLKSATEVTAEDILKAGETQAEFRFQDKPELQQRLQELFGKIYEGLGNDEQAELYFRKAIYDTPTNGPTRIEAMLSFARFLMTQRRFADATPLLEELNRNIKQVEGANLAELKLLQSYLAKSEGRTMESVQLRSEAHRIADAAEGLTSDIAIRALGDLLSQYYALDDDPNTKKYRDMMEERLKTGQLTPNSQITALHRIITADLDMHGWSEDILEKYKQEGALAKSLFGTESYRYYNIIGASASGHLALGHHQTALDLYMEILQFSLTYQADRKTSIAATQLGVARSLQELGRLEEADTYFKQAESNMRTGSVTSPGYALALGYWGQFKAQVEDYPSAQTLLEQSRDIFAAAGMQATAEYAAVISALDSIKTVTLE
ncbi:MAG: hypothetical protein DHS20C11_10120 [Lysobacteraceae bacterium]|nr:MAG: hypothetical protein DHS20C11_10120 [Xanthomonadaceae bacterium]